MNNETNDAAYRKLKGADNLKARKLYRALVEHHRAASCSVCDSYPKYGSLIIKGDLWEHITDIAIFTIDRSDFAKLKEAKLIIEEKVTPQQHRIIFVSLVKQEQTA